MIPHLFKKDPSNWTEAEAQDVQYFYKCNQFFANSLTNPKNLQEIINMSYYHQIGPQDPLYLRDNKRPVCIILLTGNIKVYKMPLNKRKLIKSLLKKQKLFSDIFNKEPNNIDNNNNDSNQEMSYSVLVGEYIGFNQTVKINSQCKVVSMHGQSSEILYVPSFLYNHFYQVQQSQKNKLMLRILNNFFPKVENKPLTNLISSSQCQIKKLKINTYLYRYGDIPSSIFIVQEGAIKMENHGYSQKKMKVVVKGANSIIGDKDLCLPSRQTSAICISSQVSAIQIPKEAFLQFAKENLAEYKHLFAEQKMGKSKAQINAHSSNQTQLFQHRKSSPLVLSTFEELQKSDRLLPQVVRVNSRTRAKSKLQEQREYKLIKNSHILLDIASPKRSKIRKSHSNFANYPVDIIESKVKLFSKMRPSPPKFDIYNKIL